MKKTAGGGDGKRVTNDVTTSTFNKTSASIGGITDGLKKSLRELDVELKKDEAGKKEYETYLQKLESQRADLEKKAAASKAWLDAYETSKDTGGSVQQYKLLLEQIEQIYGSAKEFHGKGIDILIKEFGYHIAYRRWNDTFSSSPFKPK